MLFYLGMTESEISVLHSNTHEPPQSQIPRGAFILENVAELTPSKVSSSSIMTICLFVPGLHSYLLAVGLECGRILLYTWRQGVDGHDWNGCGETDVSYPSQTQETTRTD